MKQPHLVVVLFFFALMFILSGCSEQKAGNRQNEEQYEKVRLVMTGNGTELGIETLTARHFAELVSEASGGNVQIEFYPNDELTGGNTNEAVRSLTEGAVDLGGYVSGTMSLLDPRLEIATIPWSFSSYQEARQVIDDTGGDYYAKVLSEYGLVYLGSTHNAMRQLSNNRNAVRTLKDIRGLRVRVLGGEIYRLFFSALGAEPVPLGWSELNIALQQGVVEGQENGFFVMRSGRLNEIQKYMTVWNYLYENYLFVASRKTFELLEPKTQELLREKMRESCEWSRDYLENEEKKIRRQFKDDGLEIIDLTPEELEAFKKQVAPLREQLKAKYGAEACAAFKIDMEKNYELGDGR
ncbi:MAG: DctP family TRAP transporter solute-binding subunit [Selenomonadaceae bacterium]|nr:DctP family TRAP transporter solute-binding subunit [Selenomonadaceae bacterium]